MSKDKKSSPYDWWRTVPARRPREVRFQMGRVPLNLPPHPARLEAIRRIAPLSEDYSCPEKLLATAPGFFTDRTERHVDRSGIPRSFSGECCLVANDQVPIEFFDAERVYRSCALFQQCSPGFIQELIAIGGSPAWHGKTFECGLTIYQEGQRGNAMYLIVRGTVALSSAQGQRQSGAGECIGVAQGLGVVAERQETAVARTSVHVLEVALSTLTKAFMLERDGDTSRAYVGERRLFELEARRCGRKDAGVERKKGRKGTKTASPQGTQTMSLSRTHSEEMEVSPITAHSMHATHQSYQSHQTHQSHQSHQTLGHISCLQHPRQWRQQVQRLQRELIEGDFSDRSREAFQQSLGSSITQDFNNGFQQPLDSPIRANLSPEDARQTPDREEEDAEEVATGMLELALLPSLSDMSCKQKVDLLHHMHAQNKAQTLRKSGRPGTSSNVRKRD